MNNAVWIILFFFKLAEFELKTVKNIIRKLWLIYKESVRETATPAACIRFLLKGQKKEEEMKSTIPHRIQTYKFFQPYVDTAGTPLNS